MLLTPLFLRATATATPTPTGPSLPLQDAQGSPGNIEPVRATLNRFLSREEESVYPRAASFAAKSLADPAHAILSTRAHVELAR